MIKFFRNSYFINYLMLIVMALLLWLPSFIVSPAAPHPSGTTPLYDFIVTGLETKPLLLQIIAFLLFVVEALAFNEIMIAGKIEPKVSTIGAFVFILLMGLTTEQTSFQPALLAAAFVLPVMFMLYRIPMRQSVEMDLLNVGMCIAFASMSYIYSALLLIWVVVALTIQKSSAFRLQIIPFIGFILPYFFYFAFHYLKGDFIDVVDAYSGFFTGFRFTFDGYGVVPLTVLALILLFTFVLININGLFSQERLVDVRQNINIATLLFFLTVVMMVMGDGVFTCGLMFLALSVHNSYTLSHISKIKWVEIVLDIVVLVIYTYHYLPLFM